MSRATVPVTMDCPNCGRLIRGEVGLTVTNYQPAGPPETPRATMVSFRPVDRSRIVIWHECPLGVGGE